MMSNFEQRDQALALACSTGGSAESCRKLNIEAMAMGNRVFSTEGGYVYANSPDHYDLNTSTIGSIPKNTAFEGTYQYKQAMSLQTGLQAIGPAGALKTPALFGAWSAADKSTLYGGSAGLVVDLATQLPNGVENYSFTQTLTNVTASAGAARVGTGQSMTFNIAAQGISSYGASQVNNWTNNTNANSFQAGLDSAGAATLGEGISKISESFLNKGYGAVAKQVIPPSLLIYKNLTLNNSVADNE